MNNQFKYLDEWLELSKAGNFRRAQDLYFEKLFPEVIIAFKEKVSELTTPGGTLFSILGYSPEPIILAANAIKPDKHIIITNTQDADNGTEYLDKYLDKEYALVKLKDESFLTIYKTLKEQLILNNTTNLTLDITGGKKSMVASASIFGKDYGCRVVYVDFEEYIKELRKPMPGSETLNLVYDPDRDQPEIRIK
jgi:hypothetical protein